MVTVRRIRIDEDQLLREVRLRALSDTPLAFGSTYVREETFDTAEWKRRATRAATSDDGAMFLAFDDNDCCGIIGCFGSEDQPGEACIVSMWVAPEYRRRGIGNALMRKAEEWARKQKFKQLSLDVTEGNQAAITLYEHCGFYLTGEFDRYPNHPALRELFMLKRL
jgi:ribosomal protein S18 acetylase RimI-like enzyme